MIKTLKFWPVKTWLDVVRYRAIPGINGATIIKMARWLDGSRKAQTFYKHPVYRFSLAKWLDMVRASSHALTQTWSGFQRLWFDVARCSPINSFKIEIKIIHARTRIYKPIYTLYIGNTEPHRTIEPLSQKAMVSL